MIILVAADTLSAQSSASTSITVTVFGMEIGVGNVETFKRLYQGQPANSATTLYTAPASTQTLIKTITITNPTGSAQTITFWVAGTADTNGILPPISIDAGGFAVYDDDGWKFYSNMGLFKDGVTGFTGSVGFVGSFGATGFTGSQGTIGFTGSASTVIGFTGSVGFVGSFGATGFTGSQGTIGFTGSQGTTGFVGSTGISHTLTFGAHLISGDPSFNGTAAASITSDATSSNTVSTIVARDAAGAFSMGALTATTGTYSGLQAVTVASGYAATFMGGNVGIGTTSPYGKLSVSGANADPSLTVGTVATAVFGAADGTELAITNSGSAPYTISLQGRNDTAGPSGSSYPIALNPLGGNVGIGTTNPDAKLVVGAAVDASPTNTVVAIVAITPRLSFSSDDFSLNFGSYIKSNYSTRSFMTLGTRDSAVDVDALTLKGGNVGIGTTNPAHLLEVNGTFLAAGAVTLSSTLAVTSNIVTYNNIVTAGIGVCANYGSGRVTAKTNVASGTIATYTPAADGTFIITANVLVTATTACTFTVTVTYTDEGNTARTLTLTFSQITGTFLTAITNVTGVGAYEGVPVCIRAKAATAITIQTAAGGTYTGVTYNASADILQTAA